jgi:asparagine synthase (glutamine-hydrolysing)
MCGIAGLMSFGGAAPPTRADVAAMIATLGHRGPDGASTFADGAVALAHARLSIIDLEGGWQPIANEDETVSVVFNGEIFNYIELREALQQRGHRFRTASDTEVIVHLYEEHGEDFARHLNGQFAIALWDARRRRLVLARDRTGIRPLFFVRQAQRLAFASEVKALFAVDGIERRIDPLALGQLFTWWAPLAPRTVFDGVQALPPGHVMVVEADGGTRRTRYWDWDFGDIRPDSARDGDDFAEELHALLVDAVRLQLRADVPVGAYLSGGLDSSVITSIIRHHTSTPLRTFSLTFDDAEFDESRYQQELVRYLGTEHSSMRCTRGDIAAAFARTIWHTESPVVRTAPVPMMLLAQHVREAGFKVVLTGEGADEVFGGYDLFKEAKIRRWLARSPNSAWRGRLLERLYPYLANSPAAGGAFTRRFFGEGAERIAEPGFAHLPRMAATQRIWQFLHPDVQAQLQGWDAHAALRDTLPPQLDSWHPMGRDQYVEAHTLMSGYLLSSQGDRVAMAHSIEGRYPFLDHRVIEFANRLPPKYKMRGLVEKWLLKRAMRGQIPPSILRRTKQPYRSPDCASFFHDGRPVEIVAHLMSPAAIADAGLFDPAAVAKLVAKCRAGRAIGFADNMAFVGVLSSMLLHEQFVRPAGAAVPLT